nr:lantibiotic dehydratase [Fodinicola feengrottensis]
MTISSTSSPDPARSRIPCARSRRARSCSPDRPNVCWPAISGRALSGMNFTGLAAMFGRLLPVVPVLRPALAELVAEQVRHAVPAQLLSAVVGARLGNLTQVPRVTDHLAAAGVFADPSEPGMFDIDDFVVGATDHRLFVLSARTGEEVAPLPLHAVNIANHLPNVVRLLVEIGAYTTPPWQLWSWGAAEHLPYLPRIRYGRTILTPARWLLDHRLRTDQTNWPSRFERWRAHWGIPDIVYAVRADRRLRLDLRSPLEVALLRDDVRKHPTLVLQEEPAGGTYDSGWAQGHSTEIVVPLRARTATGPPPPASYSCPALPRPDQCTSQAASGCRCGSTPTARDTTTCSASTCRRCLPARKISPIAGSFFVIRTKSHISESVFTASRKCCAPS